MWKLNVEVQKAIEKTKATSSVLLDAEKMGLNDSILSKYAISKRFKFPFWNNLDGFVSVNDKDGWRSVDDFVKGKEVIMFFEPSDEKQMFRFYDGKDVVPVLGECFGFVFYLTDASASFLLCFNDHDYLIACGSAVEWLRNRYNV